MASPREMAEAGINTVREDGFMDFARRAVDFAYKRSLGEVHDFTGKAGEGELIWDRDWDLLVVLDACRYDTFEEVSEEVAEDFDFLEGELEKIRSSGSHSREWIGRNFGKERPEDADPKVVDGNYFYTRLGLDEELDTEEAWNYARDQDSGVVLPGPLTDIAVRRGRQEDPDRMVVHYMQPHHPFLGRPELGDYQGPGTASAKRKSVWDNLMLGEVNEEEVREAYRENLEIVFEDVETLLNNYDAEKAVITADHGNSFGEKGIYGHPWKISMDALREVPWYETSAGDSEEYSPDQIERKEFDAEEGLRDLGYL
jgi:hypothetical protein